MPSKIQLDENLWFLYICLQKSDYKAIDFNAVGDVAGLKAPAARMRYTRLRRAIESGTLIGTRGTPFNNGNAGKTTDVSKKRKRTTDSGTPKDEEVAPTGQEDVGILQTRSGSRFSRNQTTEPYLSDNLASDEDSEYDNLSSRRSPSSISEKKLKVEDFVAGSSPKPAANKVPKLSTTAANAMSTPSPTKRTLHFSKVTFKGKQSEVDPCIAPSTETSNLTLQSAGKE
ncbi:MAG: 3'-5'-exoribonuclease [Chaenotheca gracillima]|nr:MAG: 3'-5'-exoribonuclease [Chaenotheca gracillima]